MNTNSRNARVATSWSSLPHRRARELALPAIASNVAVPVVGLIDTAMIGHFSDAVNLGAVGLGAAVIATVFWAFAFLRPGTTSLVGRALGAGRQADAIGHLQRALAMAAALGAAWLALQWFVIPVIVRALAQGAGAGPVAADYALIRGLSLPGVLVTLAIVGYFIGAQDTKTPLIIAGTVAGANVVFAFVAVAGFGWGARGAGWATFAAEWLGTAVAVLVLRRSLDTERWAQLLHWRGHHLRTGWRALAAMNSRLVVRSALLMGAITVVASMGSRFGDDVLAANAILLQMMYLASYALDGYATAAESMAAERIGARDVPGFHRAFAATSIAGGAIAAAMTLVFWLGRDPILAALTDLPGVTAVARHTWWAAAALPIVSGAAWMLDGVFLGTGRTRDMVASMAASVLGVFAPIVILSIATGHFVNSWLWGAFLALNVIRAATLGWRYARLTAHGAWLT